MKDFYNLDSLISLDDFPWDEVYLGLPKCKKNASIFYGLEDEESKQTNLTPEQRVWYRSLKHGRPIKGIDVLLTAPKSWKGSWFRLEESNFWLPTDNMQHFTKLQQWVKSLNVFEGTGRQIFFLQFQNECSPPHVDEDISKIPNNVPSVREFIWLTPKQNGKKLLVNGVPTSNITWFNSYAVHETRPESGVRWSLRIDGKFTEEFKRKINTLT